MGEAVASQRNVHITHLRVYCLWVPPLRGNLLLRAPSFPEVLVGLKSSFWVNPFSESWHVWEGPCNPTPNPKPLLNMWIYIYIYVDVCAYAYVHRLDRYSHTRWGGPHWNPYWNNHFMPCVFQKFARAHVPFAVPRTLGSSKIYWNLGLPIFVAMVSWTLFWTPAPPNASPLVHSSRV